MAIAILGGDIGMPHVEEMQGPSVNKVQIDRNNENEVEVPPNL